MLAAIMNSMSRLNTAKLMLRQKQFQEAIALFNALINERSDAASEAAYCLGVVYQSGEAVPVNIDEAMKYYSIAEQSGYPMATYQLAGIYYKSGESKKAYEAYRSIAESNPSAAYWAYRLLVSDQALDGDPKAHTKYLDSAADQGHVLAQRVRAMEYLSGKRGKLKFLNGVPLFVKMMCDAFRITSRREKLKYE